MKRHAVLCCGQADFEKRANPNDPAQQALIEELRAHVKKVQLGARNGKLHAHLQ